MTAVQKRIMLRACRLRMKNGEELADILAGYPRLTAEEKAELTAEVQDET